jgi:hypothetical protein
MVIAQRGFCRLVSDLMSNWYLLWKRRLREPASTCWFYLE